MSTSHPSAAGVTSTGIRSHLNTYTGYSIGSAAVWAILLATGRGMLGARNWEKLRLGAAAWWMGWLSATIARAGYPPPQQLTEADLKRLERVSLALVLLGLGNFVRFLVTGRRHTDEPADQSS